MIRRLKVTTEAKKFDSDIIETFVMYVVITDKDNLDTLVQMSYGSWYDIMNYSYEEIDIDIHVSDNYCKRIAAKFLTEKK